MKETERLTGDERGSKRDKYKTDTERKVNRRADRVGVGAGKKTARQCS